MNPEPSIPEGPWLAEGALRPLAQALRDGQRDAASLARQTVEHIHRADPVLRAFTAVLDAADAQRRAQALVGQGPLAGLPVAVKDIFETADLPTAWGTPLHQPGRASARDAAVVALLRSAGALVVGKSATTEFAFLHPAPTLNPAAAGHTPGGSSAGSAAAVAAGLVPLAVGTQTGGSVIRPASYCGVVGYKPSFGWLPTAGASCFSWSIDTVGVFARQVDDAAFFVEALAGRRLVAAPLEADASAPAVVGLLSRAPWGEGSPSTQRAMDRAVSALKDAGVEICSIELTEAMTQAYDAHAVIQGFEAVRCLGAEWREHRAALSSELRAELERSMAFTPAAYEAAQAVAAAARHDHQPGWAGVDAVLLPSAPDEPPAGYASTGVSSFNRLWTLLGGPCVGLPAGAGVNGHPVGVQLVAPFGQDARVLRLAARLEASLARAAFDRGAAVRNDA